MSTGKPVQQSLLVAADEQYREQKLKLYQALEAVRARVGVTTWVKIVFERTGGGSRVLTRTYKELAESGPDWFGYESPETIRGWVEQATAIGLTSKRPTFSTGRSRGANQYMINWSGVDAIIAEHRRRFGDPTADPATIWQRLSDQTSGPSDQTSGPSDQTSGPSDQTSGPSDQANNSSNSCISSSCFSFPGPEPEPVPCPVGTSKKSRSISLGDLAQLPAIAANLERTVAPLPAGDLAYGVFGPLKPKTFERPEPSVLAMSLAIWFRRQLSAPQPISGDTVAELLMIIAAGFYAANVPAAEVKKNRAAVFITTLTRNQWFRATRFMPRAEEVLDQVLSEIPDLLTCPDGAWRSAECKTS